ncbi:MAG: hypothetical protein ACYC7A_22440 [Thermoanaerobaculia bacterium]
MKKIVFLLLAMFVLATPAFAGKDPERTFGIMNGRSWNQMADDTKIGYVAALIDGLKFILIIKEEPTPLLDSAINRFKVDFTHGQIIGQITKIYRDPANLNIPLPFAAEIGVARLKGESEAVIEKRLDYLRKNTAD